MAIFSVSIDDNDVDRVINAICKNYNRPDRVQDPQNPAHYIENPEHPSVFANRIVREFLVDNVKKVEIEEARAKLEEQIRNPVINDPQA